MTYKLEDLEQLLEAQKTDLELLKLQKELRALPQREKAAKLLEKKAALEKKDGQIAEIRAKTMTELNKLENEDAHLVEKEKHAQELIESAGSDYRSVESHTKELDGFAKRRATLDEKLESLSADLGKIESLAAQVGAAIKRVDEEIEANKREYAAESGRISARIHELDDLRTRQLDNVDVELAKQYEETARKTAGVAIGRLVEGRCGVCRASIDGGKLIELRANAPLGICPSCKRMLVIG